MSYEQFIQLSETIAPLIQKEDTTMRKSISPKKRLVLTLWFLPTGENFRLLKYQFQISRKAISYVVSEVSQSVYRVLASEYEIYCRLIEKWHFPHCFGAINGKHITNAECGMGPQYFNYKGTHPYSIDVRCRR